MKELLTTPGAIELLLWVAGGMLLLGAILGGLFVGSLHERELNTLRGQLAAMRSQHYSSGNWPSAANDDDRPRTARSEFRRAGR